VSFPNLSAIAVRERQATLFFMVLSLLAGLYAFASMGRAEDPAFTVRMMVVSALWPGATPAELRDQVASRLEKRVQEVDYLDRIDTTIRPGRVDLQIEFHTYTPGDKLPELFYQVRKRVQDEAASLPRGVVGPLVNDDFGDVFFTLIAATAPGLPMRELTRELEVIRDRLTRVPGVHKALLIGERPERVWLEFDRARLGNLAISPQQIFEAIEANNRLAPAGRVDTAGPRIYLRVDADLADPQVLAATPLRVDGRALRLGDLATVRRGYEEPPSYLVRAGGVDTLLLGVVMRRGENGLQFGERLTRFLDAERARLPLGMSLSQLTNQADAITAAVNLFQLKFLVAVAVVMGVSVLAIGWRAGLVVGIAIPLTLGLTFLAMKLRGINLDRITLGALIIALGLLVDDAIIAIEMMIVKIAEGWDRVRAAAHAWTVTAAPMLFGTLVTVAGFVPIGFAKSGVGEYAGNIFWVLGIALIVSWLVAVVFTPWLGVRFLAESAANGPGAGVYDTPRYRQLRRLVAGCVRRRKTVVGLTLLALGLAVAAMAGPVQKQFFPTSDRKEVLVSVYLPQGSAFAATDSVVRRLEAVLRERTEVRTLSAYVGAGAPRFFISANPEQPDPAFGKLVVVTHDVASRDALMAELERRIAAGEFPEARVRVARLLYGPPVQWPVSFRVVGPDERELRRIAHELRRLMAAHPNLKDPHLEWDERVPVLRFAIDHERLRQYGLTPAELAQQLQFHTDGVPVVQLRQDIRSVELRARGIDAGGAASGLAGVELFTAEGRKLPLSQLGEAELAFEDPVLRRYNREPCLAVHAEVRGAQPNTVTQAIEAQMAPLVAALPEGYRIDTGGSVEQSAKADGSIRQLQPVMAALMLIFVMLQMRSFSGTVLVVATAPLGVIGAALALLVFDKPFGFVALLGLIGLAGILMRNTLILTQQVSDNLAEGLSAFEAVVEAAVRRARPVLLTALAAGLAFVPLTFDSFWGPLAYVLIGGVLVGTLITLLFVPALYALWFRIPARP
jgi:multidrug efflux pump subunit AcrB